MGLLHSRLRFLTLKSPQVALHSDQCPQELQPPSTSLSTQEKNMYVIFEHSEHSIAKIILQKNWERLIARLKK